ncbi:MAG: hypothetical protein ACRD4D_08780 [Candidatus Acidiferrales bacterium]
MKRTLRQLGFWLFLVAAFVPPAASQAALEKPAAPAADQAEQLFSRMLEAMGGEKFLRTSEIYGRGRIYSFNRGDLSSPGERFVYYAKFPGKERIEFGKKGSIAYVNNGDQGWELDRQGIREQTPEAIEEFQQSNRRDFHNVLRARARGETIKIYLIGRQFVDNRRVHILELVDERNETAQLYIDANNDLPLQLRYRERDALTREWLDVVEFYGKYITVQGIKTAMHISRTRGKMRVLEVYFSEISYNSGVADSLFTRESLEERWAILKK